MKALVYYLSIPLIYLVSVLPFWVLYRLSDFLYFTVYKLFGYRRDVVHRNLINAFPEKSEAEIKRIKERFYRYFFDLILETIKSLSISPDALRKHIQLEDVAIFKKYYEKNQSIIIVMGHFGNWELGGARFALEPLHKLYVVYHPLSNKYFDRLMYRMRTRLGNGLYPMKGTLRGMVSNRKSLTATAFIADQTPSRRGAYWMQFLHQDTPVFTGMGKIANKFNYPVVYVSVRRTRRGYYSVFTKELIIEPGKQEAEQIMSAFIQTLEKDIIAAPETWLWSHKRWKHKRSEEEKSQVHA